MEYKSSRWRIKRIKIIKRDKYLCQNCNRYGKRIDATLVHHIYPADKFQEYAFCDWNLISLCGRCHEKMHDKTNNVLTPDGEKLKRLADKRKMESPPL